MSPQAAQAPPFAVQGVAYDALGDPLPGVTVEALDGRHLAAVTDSSGRFSFAEPFTALVELRATKTGYKEFRRSYGPTDASANRVFWLKLESLAPPGLSPGAYRLTFRSDDACGAIPQELRTRTYMANFSGTNHDVVKVYGGQFASGDGYGMFNVLYVSQLGAAAQFNFNDPPIVEQIGHAWLQIYGGAQGDVHGASGTLAGWGTVWYCERGGYGGSALQCSTPIATCALSPGTLLVERQ